MCARPGSPSPPFVPLSRRRVGRVADKKITRHREASQAGLDKGAYVTLRFNLRFNLPLHAHALPCADCTNTLFFFSKRASLANVNFWIKNIMPSLSPPPPPPPSSSRQCSPKCEFETYPLKTRTRFFFFFQNHTRRV